MVDYAGGEFPNEGKATRVESKHKASQHYAGKVLEPKPPFSSLTPKQRSGLRGILDDAEEEYYHQGLAAEHYGEPDAWKNYEGK